jgi:NADPH-dependent curcumin reductase CurA
MAETKSREVRLKKRRVGMPQESDFELAKVMLPEPGAGEVLARNIYMSVDPYMRGRMADRKSSTPPFQLGEALTGGCVGQVVRSCNDRYQPGDIVLGMQGWLEFSISQGSDLRPVDPAMAPI